MGQGDEGDEGDEGRVPETGPATGPGTSETGAVPTLPAKVAVAADVVWQQVDGQIVVLELNAGRYYTLDAVGSRMWEALVECSDVPSATDQLLAEYDVDDATLRHDLAELIDMMVRAGLVVSTGA